ncbi:hypothetical protein LTR64_006720 [Lithohypha guttulata]|uniref:uncharacterized protein n=1 Tax=Lithohypha guttulata TaxID=1690604 RepID=UPI00315D383B
MNRFGADYSSSPASTPVAASKARYRARNETPDLVSTTPIAPPPSRPFGSSQYQSVSKLRFTENARDLPQPNSFGLSTDSQQPHVEDMLGDDADDDQYTQYTQDHARSRNLYPTQSLMKFSTDERPQTLRSSAGRSTNRLQQYSLLPRNGQEAFVPGLARDLKRRTSITNLENDPDPVIVQTEQVIRSVQEDAINTNKNVQDEVLAEAATELETVWERSKTSRRRRKDEDLSIGPGPGATPFENARYTAVLILRLYHASKIPQDEVGVMSMPQILLDWLNEYHMTIETAYNQVINHPDNVTADVLFWDVIEALTARGKIEEAVRLLGDADFSYAKVDNEAGLVDADYTGPQLQAIQTAVLQVRQTLNASPAIQTQDWSIDGYEWVAYRKDVQAALEELRESTDIHDDSELLEAEADTHLVRPGKGLPFEIFERLQTVYSIMLGSSADLITISQDWLEASILLTVWWNGNQDNKVQQWSFDVSRAHPTEQNTELETQAYLNRLKESFLAVTDPSSRDTWQLNHQSPLELAIALTLQGDMPSVLSLVQIDSLCLSSALAEIGSWSGWLNSNAVPDGLDRDDLMVLTGGTSNATISKDEILERYSHELFKKTALENSQSTVVDGWEIAISVISRCDNQSLASRTVQQYIEELEVTTADRAERLVTLCGELGMAEEARKVSEQYGDHLVDEGTDYGTALLCYARSQAESKVRQLIDVLNSYCLVQSRAYPSEAEIDHALSRLVSNPRQALSGIADMDPQAVGVLQFYLVGYACIRRYYTTRDNAAGLSKTAQKKTAARALVAAINSAADSIYGGLYDPTRQSAIQVDGLLTLLAEASALTAEHSDGVRIFTSDQLYAILAAIEDLQSVNDRVYAAIEDCLDASLRQFRGSQPPSPHAMLKKSISSGTNSNFSFSMMGSEMLARSSESLGGRSTGSAVLVGGRMGKSMGKEDTTKGWDWRSCFKSADTTGADVLRYLRTEIAAELAMANLEEGFK